jgi:hypothetical protein
MDMSNPEMMHEADAPLLLGEKGLGDEGRAGARNERRKP